MFKEYLKELLGSDFDSVWASFFAPKKSGFFITDKSAKKRILEQFKGAKELFDNFYIYDDKSALSHSEFFSAGQIYIQNPSSYLATLFLELCMGDEFCDMCASPGGKSIALFSRFGSISGAAIEYDKSRFLTHHANSTTLQPPLTLASSYSCSTVVGRPLTATHRRDLSSSRASSSSSTAMC